MNAIAQASAGPVSGSKLDNRRVLAALIDLAVVAAGAAVIMGAAGVLGESPSEMGGALTVVTLGWALYYYFACESGNGQTLGKRAMKIRVVRTDGSPAGMREIGIRTVLRVVDGLFLYLVGLIVMMATGERRGRLGDLAGDTMIVSADAPAAPKPAPTDAEPASRVPIAESGPAFAPAAEEAADEEPAPEVEAPAAEVAEPAAEEPTGAEPEVASPALQELAADVSVVTSAPDREVDEPVVEEAEAEEPDVQVEAPAAEVEEPVAEAEEPVAEAEERVVDDEPAEVTVKSVETVSAIDLVMEDSRRDG
jgi:uncharacterized RDD family membrane protein YckC